jgi:hypothetical protein
MHTTITQTKHPSARALRTARTRAATLLEDGYRLDITDAAPGSVHVRKPVPSSTLYTVRLFYDHAHTRWRYACDCPFFARHDECKHGRRVHLEFTQALALVRHVAERD